LPTVSKLRESLNNRQYVRPGDGISIIVANGTSHPLLSSGDISFLNNAVSRLRDAFGTVEESRLKLLADIPAELLKYLRPSQGQ
jgi:hypothetical protein